MGIAMTEDARGADPFQLETFLPYRMQRLTALLTADFFAGGASRGAPGWTEWYVLSLLAREGQATATDINARSGLGKTAISRAVSSLEDSGFLKRERDTADRRVEWLQISPAGLAEQEALGRKADAYAARLLSICKAEDLYRMGRLLSIIEENLLAGRSLG